MTKPTNEQEREAWHQMRVLAKACPSIYKLLQTRVSGLVGLLTDEEVIGLSEDWKRNNPPITNTLSGRRPKGLTS